MSLVDKNGPEDDFKVKYAWNADFDKDLQDFYRSLPRKDPSTVRVFNRASQYTFFGADAVYIGMRIKKTVEIIRDYEKTNDCGEKLIPHVNLSSVMYHSLLKELIPLYNMKVHLFSVNDDGNWALEYDASPGNIPESLEKLFDDKTSHVDASGVLAVHFVPHELKSSIDFLAKEMSSGGQTFITASNEQSDHIRYAAVYIDTLSKQINIASSFDHPVHLSAIESLLIQLAPREIIVSKENECITKRLQEVSPPFISHCETAEASFFKQVDDKILTKLQDFIIKSDTHMIEATFNSLDEKAQLLTKQALCGAMKFLNLENNSSNFNQYELELISLSELVRLDAAAVSSLNLFVCQANNVYSSLNVANQTVFGLLNHCKTRNGRRLLSQWIRQPLFNLDKLTERQNIVEFFADSAPARKILPDKLRVLPDLPRLTRKLYSASVNLTDLYSTHLAIKSIEGFVDSLEGFVSSNPRAVFMKRHFIDPLTKCQQSLQELQKIVNQVIDFAHYKARKELRISPKYDEKLALLTEQRDELEDQLNSLHKRAIADTNIDALKLSCLSDEVYFFACTKKASENFEKCARKYQEVHSNKKDQKRFTCHELDQLNPSLQSIKAQYRRREGQIIADICQQTSRCCSGLRDLSSLYTLLDVYLSLATAAVASNDAWVKPQLHPPSKGQIRMKKLRHPCVEVDRDICYIPNDVNLGDKRLFVLTGPNMGGKSTYIRSVGIAVLLAQIGSFVPADEAVISIVDGIYTRIGAGDRQLQGNSTFMAEMVETSSILRSATDKSLIMIDELGRGTSTYDGFGIAWAVAHHIATQLKSFCLFASHFFELTKLEDDEPSVGNLHVTVHVDSKSHVTMTYQINEGRCLNSYGVLMAKSADFPEEIIQTAQEKLRDLECDFDGVRINAPLALADLRKLDVKSIADDKLADFVADRILKFKE